MRKLELGVLGLGEASEVIVIYSGLPLVVGEGREGVLA